MILEKQKPYMLRNDGKIHECGDRHPYIIYDVKTENPKESFVNLFMLKSYSTLWFYTHTHYETIREYIRILAVSFDKIYGFKEWTTWREDLEINDKETGYTDLDTIAELVSLLNRETNNEFCRVRTSDMYFRGNEDVIYFRISSTFGNWFNPIWNVVYENRNSFGYMTIVKDEQSFKNISDKNLTYKINGRAIQHFPINDFIVFNGNPVIEKYLNYSENIKRCINNIHSGKTITESIYGNLDTKNMLLSYCDDFEFENGYGWQILS